MRTTVSGREQYVREINAARASIEALPEMKDARDDCEVRKARAMVLDGPMRTLNAWNYGSAGEALARLRKRWHARVRDVLVVGGAFNGPHFARVSCQAPHGIEFWSQRDVFLMRPVGRRIMHPGFSDSLLFVQPGCLLVGSHGQLNEGSIFGKVVMVDDAMSKSAFTQDILRMYIEDESREIAYAFLSTSVGCRLLRTTAVGTSIPSMHLDLLGDLPFPEVSEAVRAAVTTHVRAAMSARAAATAAEREAVRIVEEEVLPEWLA